MKKLYISFIAVIVLFFLVLFIEAQESVTYISDIKPIIDSQCTSCHDWADTFEELTTVSGTRNALTNGVPIVNVASPDSSLILWRLEGQIPEGAALGVMPQSTGKMDDAVIQKFRTWIEQGAHENIVGVDDKKSWGEIKLLLK